MAQTKRKRTTKHRGNAAGMIEARGRAGTKGGTGRGSTAPPTKEQARIDRMNREPTWRSAMLRAAFAAAFFVVALILLFKEEIAATIGIGALVFLLYIPLGYYTDRFIYQRRIKKGVITPPKKGKA